ncbi:hypothetical protein FC80_GL001479 [Liquorilactobacillus cacaonum DSM 21116]|uniref:Prebacteriocin n=2 Tax=Liquorilactobacillus cacaonum TaxID=483012 RepID=A0A0R2CEE7_9LACO|nr:hypothetical protein FC80_GL001479 [Liquorilactobacillus cacaonum DSM 21116]
MIMTEKNDEKVSKFLDQLSVAYADEQIKKQPDAQQFILESAQELEKTQNCDLVASKLVKKIVMYYWPHKNDFPEALITLHKQVKGYAVKYDAIATTALIMPIWF